jgi:hypothetical protein
MLAHSAAPAFVLSNRRPTKSLFCPRSVADDLG